ncbi:MAG: amidohydrolase family protein [Planctomycetota bacterium]|nr:amidohydrolase family protein [Planctomycetota bacterium]MDA1251932.1 amidohydrolase family protein [Planctomycetota bacterium]
MSHENPINATRLNRREMLVAGAAAAVGAASIADAADEKMGPWIDAHSHIWTPDTVRYPLLKGQTKKDLDPPSFTDDELMKIASPHGVGRVVLIAHTGYYGFDNSYLIDAWTRHPKRFRVVGMVDDHKPNTGRTIKRLARTGVTGFRIKPPKAGDKGWLKTPGMIDMWKTAAETGQAMCGLINPEDLAEFDRMAGEHPGTKAVIDHFARVGVSGTVRDEDVEKLCRLARHKNVYVKISAYYALGKKTPPYDDLVPMIRRVYDSYGPNRLMWASDCPYQLGGNNNTYEASIDLIKERIDFLSDEDRQWLLKKTAESVFLFA